MLCLDVEHMSQAEQYEFRSNMEYLKGYQERKSNNKKYNKLTLTACYLVYLVC